MKNPKRNPPSPIIDNLEFIGNPFKVAPQSPNWISFSNAQKDLELSLRFLYSYNGSSATFNSYRRELERLLQWAWQIEKTSILELQREHVEEFINFCINPPEAWIGIKNVARFKKSPDGRIPNKDWRPFVVSVSKEEFKRGKEANIGEYFPSQAAIKATFTAISSFYDYLLQEGEVSSNPVALIRQKSKFISRDQQAPIVRRISNIQWDYVLETAELLADQDPEEHERTLFIMNALFAMYLRISELVADERSTPLMCDFERDRDGNWWFKVTGKGNKNRRVTVCDDMLKSLKRYREHLNLSPLPNINDKSPILPKYKGSGGITSTRHVRLIVQNCFDAAHNRMLKGGLEQDADDLRIATVHWLRHTGISEDVKHRPREHVRDDAGHASMATTDRYIESDLRERHESGRNKRVREI
ncbi:tyrosine-type recombinase/integrase [Alkalimarinus sediminis]|uniref:Site-specific integrase n=1 Tax=Alkalimarinus sediminis TaxID=1632866 RepID=A0A9E8HL06_9ALTE|nr:site-specific integrase [Alkalimarinus sediminis]UZW76270.1 site-specific integrase [Alkalimarinus sediminis]